VSDHRPEVHTRHAMGTAEGQDCVGQHWGAPPLEQRNLARRIPNDTPRDLAENQKGRWEPHGYPTDSCAEKSAGVPTGWQVQAGTKNTSQGRLRLIN
jgi:hypothetical protein